MKKRDLEHYLKSLGWVLEREGSRHEVWSKGRGKIAVPRHREIREGTAKKIMKQAKGYFC